jgi:RNA polymerase sigma factor (sigma-70 family)
MSDGAQSLEALFVENLPVLERAVASFGRRYGMSADEIADLASSIKLRIVEDGYAVLARFRGESSLSTYLTVVVTMFAREHQVAERGRWRPSAEALRRGSVAVRLETLIYQKGHSLVEAAAVMRSRGDTVLTDSQLGDLLRQLPRRGPMRPLAVSEDALAITPAPDSAATREAGEARAGIERVLEECLGGLALEDRLLLKLRFWQQASIADSARILGVEQRPLYRRLEKLLHDLKSRLATAGVNADDIREFLSEAAQ